MTLPRICGLVALLGAVSVVGCTSESSKPAPEEVSPVTEQAGEAESGPAAGATDEKAAEPADTSGPELPLQPSKDPAPSEAKAEPPAETAVSDV